MHRIARVYCMHVRVCGMRIAATGATAVKRDICQLIGAALTAQHALDAQGLCGMAI